MKTIQRFTFTLAAALTLLAATPARAGAPSLGSPQIAVEQPSATFLTSGSSVVSFASTAVGGTSTLTFTVDNYGVGPLTFTAPGDFTFDGANGSDFSVTTQPAASVPDSTTFVVSFVPSASGLRSGTMHIYTNATNVNPFDITLTGTGIAPTVVTNTNDSGAGSLRQALLDTGSNGAITFAPYLAGQTIVLGSELDVKKSVTIIGLGANKLAVSGNQASRVFYIERGRTVAISGLTIENGSSKSFGGGIYNDGATLSLSACTVSGNSVSGVTLGGEGGGIYSINRIVNNVGSPASLQISNSTISGNSSSYGGGIYNEGGDSTASVQISNSTLSGNSADYGSGIFNDGAGGMASVQISNSTLSGNTATTGGSIYNWDNGGTANLEIGNTILNAGDASGNIVNDSDTPGTVTSDGYNLSSDDGGGFLNKPTDRTGTSDTPLDLMLGVLQDNGGPTPTIALLNGSPAIDAGHANTVTFTSLVEGTTDQRGFPRTAVSTGGEAVPPSDGTDIGAFEGRLLTVTTNADPAAVQVIITTDSLRANDTMVTLDLRDAIGLANSGSDADVIEFDPSLIGQTITLSGSALNIQQSLIIHGGTNSVSVSGNNASGVFFINHPGTTVAISGLTIQNGSAGTGGGIYNAAALSLSNCTLSGNSAPSGQGGGIYNEAATLSLSYCTLSGNSARYDGGGIYNDGAAGTASVQLSNSTLSGNSTSDDGGNGDGGAIFNDGDYGIASVQISNSTLSGNSAPGGDGGAIFNDGDGGTAILQISCSTLSGNSAFGGEGGGIFNKGDDGTASLQVSNSTLSGNSADQNGGGICNVGTPGGTASVQIGNSTFSGNTTRAIGGGIFNIYQGGPASVEIGSTIMDTGTATGFNIANVGGTVTSDGYNLSSDAGATTTYGGSGLLNATGDMVSTPPYLDPAGLANHGGPTQTIALSGSSPALDAGKANGVTFTNPVFVTGTGDQRGFARTVDLVSIKNASDGTDIGAYEAQTLPLAAPTVTTLAATLVSATGATLNATVNANASDTAVAFAYSSALSGTITVPATPTTVTGSTDTAASAVLTALTPNTQYSFYATGTSAAGLTTGSAVSFTTAYVPPVALSGSASALAGATSTLALPFISPDADGKSVTVTSATGANLTVTGTSGMNVTYVPAPGFSGITYLVYTVNDGSGKPGASVTATITVTVAASLVVTNTSDHDPGSLRQALLDAPPGATVTFAPNLAGQTIVLTGGELDVTQSVTITGLGANKLAVSGNQNSTVFYIAPSTNVTISGLTIENGSTAGDGDGGGIINDAATLSLSYCTVSGNSAANGGGILNLGALSISHCTISGNSASDNAGGGIYNNGLSGSASVQVSNSTLSGNLSGFAGGGIFNDGNTGSASVQISNSTLSGNSAADGGGIFNTDDDGTATVEIGNTILDKGGAGGANIVNHGTVTSDGFNLSSDNTDDGNGGTLLNQSTDILNTVPMLGVLQDNGGPTPTIALLDGSPAIDAGKAGTVTFTSLVEGTTDQRGFARTVDLASYNNASGGDGTDIGAFEGRLFTVNSTNDDPGNQVIVVTSNLVKGPHTNTVNQTTLTLRDAIGLANSGSDADVIEFDPNYLTGQTINLSGTQLEIAHDLVIHGLGANELAVAGGSTSRVFAIDAGANVSIAGLTIESGNFSNFDNNNFLLTQSLGGGIYIDHATLALTACAVGNNFATNGGGVFNSGGNLTLSGCTFNDNEALFGGGVESENGSVQASNSTFYGNLGFFDGSAIGNEDGSVQIASCTFNNNGTIFGIGGILYNDGNLATLEIGNTILDNNGETEVPGPSIANTVGTVTSDGYNLSSDNIYSILNGTHDQTGVDPQLGGLQYNGGPTQTCLPNPGSPVVDAGERDALPALTVVTDQRGYARPYIFGDYTGDGSDIGAVEVQPGDLPSPPPPPAPVLAVSEGTGMDTVSVNSGGTDDFGTVNDGYSSKHYFTLTNTGSSTLTITGATFTDGTYFQVSGGIGTLDPGDYLPVTVTFSPTTASSSYSDTLTITSNDANSPFVINFTGGGQNTDPVLTLPTSPIVVEATGPGGANVNFTVTANDNEDGSITPNVSPSSGSLFPLGKTTVNASVTDAAGAMTSGSFTVTVQDTTPPAITVYNTTTLATSASGAFVSFTPATAVDLVDPTPTITYSKASGSFFPLGTTVVTGTATDGAVPPNSSTATFTVTVLTANAVTLPAVTGSSVDSAGVPLSGVPPGAIWGLFDIPGLDAAFTSGSGGVPVFQATFTAPSLQLHAIRPHTVPPPSVMVTYSGVFGFGGSSVLLAKSGDPAPGTTGTFASFDDPVGNGGTAFIGTLLTSRGGPTTANNQGLWSNAFPDGDGELHLLARTGSPAPYLGVNYKSIDGVALNDGQNLFWTATLTGPAASNKALFTQSSLGGIVHVVMQAQKTSLSSRDVKSFIALNSGPSLPGGPGYGTGRPNGGATTPVFVTFNDNSTAVASAGADIFDVIALSGNYAPGGTALWKSFGLPAEGGGSFAFRGTLTPAYPGSTAVTATNAAVLCLKTSGSAPFIFARQSGTAPGLAPLTYAAFSDPVLNGNGDILYFATLSGSGVQTTSNQALFVAWNDAGAFECFQRTGKPAPEIPGVLIGAFTGAALPQTSGSSDPQGPVFTATLKSGTVAVTAANNSALFAADSSGALRLLARTGVTVINGKTLKTIGAFSYVLGSPVQARASTTATHVIYRATFTDLTQAIVEVPVPAPVVVVPP